MKMFVSGAMLLALLFAKPETAAAQRTYSTTESQVAAAGVSGSGFYDWIHKLSGPGFGGPGLSLMYQFDGKTPGAPGPRLYGAGAFRSVNANDKANPDDAEINMNTLQPMAEFPLPRFFQPGKLRPFVGAGLAVHSFSGKDFDDFWKLSFPLKLVLRWSEGLFGKYLIPAVDVAGHYLPKFDEADFAPLNVSVPRNRGEVILTYSVALELRLWTHPRARRD